MEEVQIDAVELVRRIRDEHQEILKRRDTGKRRSFYQERARELHERLRLPTMVKEKNDDGS